MNTNIILIDKTNTPVGETSVIDAHLGEAKMHRAYTAILKNSKGEILLTKRSLKKPLWPLYWDGSFSSHPRVDENLEQSCVRRAKEELGVIVEGFKELFSYNYHIKWNSVFSEWENNHILIAEYNSGKLQPNEEEVSEYMWMDWKKAKKFSSDEKNMIAPWWVLAVKNSKINNI